MHKNHGFGTGVKTLLATCLAAVLFSGGFAAAEPPSPLRVNQLGYLPDGPKRATFVTESTAPLDWQLVDKNGEVRASGKTVRQRFDPASLLDTHLIDFNAFSGKADMLKLTVGRDESPLFAVNTTLYDRLRNDALFYFYLARSGIAIEADIAGETYARPAGHLGQSPNRGDITVPCLSADKAKDLIGTGWSCAGARDLRGGWYDAGDHGKYVVNGGISVAQLLSTYERATLRAGAGSPALQDGWLRLPESANGVPDILDEARWELDFLLRMQIPQGQPLAGMVHHKVHDDRWAPMPLMPHQNDAQRVVYPPTTAATLNLAAAAAQAARLFKPHDAAYSARLMKAARRAYDAAKANPELFMPWTDGNQGGGDYADDDVRDEFFWAAVELFISTGEMAYLEDARASDYWTAEIFDQSTFDWRNVASIPKLQLAALPSALPNKDRSLWRKTVIAAADALMMIQQGEAFGVLFGPRNHHYPWGSNSAILNNMIIVATAYDLTGEKRYRDAVRESMDYLLGRNALGLSYITGYGTNFAQNQHSRTFAPSLDPSLPRPPDGTLAGGPNVDLSDNVSSKLLKGCAPQACYIDNIEAFAVNEMGINWNAPLAWIANFLADTAD